jgi:hypothetical protein
MFLPRARVYAGVSPNLYVYTAKYFTAFHALALFLCVCLCVSRMEIPRCFAVDANAAANLLFLLFRCFLVRDCFVLFCLFVFARRAVRQCNIIIIIIIILSPPPPPKSASKKQTSKTRLYGYLVPWNYTARKRKTRPNTHSHTSIHTKRVTNRTRHYSLLGCIFSIVIVLSSPPPLPLLPFSLTYICTVFRLLCCSCFPVLSCLSCLTLSTQ